MAKQRQTRSIHGEVAPGFEPVKALFERNMRTYREANAQLCVYVGEDRVVDLWASATDDPAFNADSLINVFSSGKSLEAIAVGWLVSQGRLNYADKVSDHWPEFAARDKAELTIADVMRHEAGLAVLRESLDPADLLTENIKQNKVGKVIEQQERKYREGEGNQREYHAITRGWIVNEIFRRADARRRTIGEFLRGTLTGPMAADVIIGVKKEDLHRISKVSPIGTAFHFKESLKPRFMGRRVTDNIVDLGRKIMAVLPAMLKGTARGAPPPFAGVPIAHAFNTPAVAMGETPSANAHCSARGLARLAAVMANGGRWQDIEFIGSDAWKAMHDRPITRNMGMTTTFTQGGLAQFDVAAANAGLLEKALCVGREGYYGWMGLGGSIFQWDPDRRVGFAFVPTALHVLDFVNERGKVYQVEVERCLTRL